MNFTITPELRSLYIHWPFCPYKCHFCPFVALAAHDQFMGQYHDALKQEIKDFARKYPAKIALDTIFFGGGTPSTWPDALLLDMVSILKEVFHCEGTREITIEVNPGTVRTEQLTLWKSLGITRLSIGVQGLKDSVLNILNRKQSKSDVLWVLQEASQVFENLSVDLILGLPEVSFGEWQELLQTVVQWPIKHVSVYFLTVHEETLLYYKVQKKEVSLHADEAMVHDYEWTIQFLKEHGFVQYEISNFSKPGYESRHNTVYWDRKPYKGFGLGACSFDGKSRFQNQKNLMKYIAQAMSQQDTTVFSESLTPQQVSLERIMLGLRRTAGISREELEREVEAEKHEHLQQAIALLAESNFVKIENDRIMLTSAGLAMHNEIAVRLSV